MGAIKGNSEAIWHSAWHKRPEIRAEIGLRAASATASVHVRDTPPGCTRKSAGTDVAYADEKAHTETTCDRTSEGRSQARWMPTRARAVIAASLPRQLPGQASVLHPAKLRPTTNGNQING